LFRFQLLSEIDECFLASGTAFAGEFFDRQKITTPEWEALIVERDIAITPSGSGNHRSKGGNAT
jgi:hypothetical protein